MSLAFPVFGVAINETRLCPCRFKGPGICYFDDGRSLIPIPKHTLARDARLESPCHSLEIREGGVRCLIQAAMSLGPGAQRPETLDDKFLPGIGAVQLRQHFEPGSPVVEEVIVNVRVGGIGAQGAE